jgi:ATP-dependent protease ClpP protease subunit
MNTPRRWFDIKQAGERAKIYIYDQIGIDWLGGGVSAKQFIDELGELDAAAPIDLYINSPGGQVAEGTAIYNALLRHDGEIHTTIDGWALSIASLIALAGETVTMAENGLYMIHNAWTVVQGNSDDLRTEAELLDKVDEGMITAYDRKTGAGRDRVGDWMRAETWFTAAEAKDAGFIDHIAEPLKAAACFDLGRYGYKNEPQRELYRAKVLIAEHELADRLGRPPIPASGGDH